MYQDILSYYLSPKTCCVYMPIFLMEQQLMVIFKEKHHKLHKYDIGIFVIIIIHVTLTTVCPLIVALFLKGWRPANSKTKFTGKFHVLITSFGIQKENRHVFLIKKSLQKHNYLINSAPSKDKISKVL